MRLSRIWRILQIEEDVIDGVKADEKDNKLRDLSNSTERFIIHLKDF